MKMENNRFAAAIMAVCGLAVTSYGQVANPETEANENKASATAAASGGAGMAPLDYITGNSTGNSTTVAGPGSIDYFRVKTAAAAPGIYRYRLTLTTTGTAGHTGSIRGTGQTAAAQAVWAGVVGTASATEATLQTSSATSTPARFNQWYGFGGQEEFYYTVAGVATTTGDYVSTLERTAIVPTNVGTYVPGSIIIKSFGQGHTTDTDFWVYDSNFNPIPGYGNDDEAVAAVSNVPGTTGTTLNSALNRTYAPGVYYIAMSVFQSGSNRPSPSDDDFRTGTLSDFAGIHFNSSTTVAQNMAFSISDGTTTTPVPNTHAGAFDVNWFTFTVAGVTGACCLGAPSYTCIVTSPAGCTTAGGTYAGDNVLCINANCPPAPQGACCLTNGDCQFITAAQCTTAGGTYAGDTVTCAAANCPPGGACCTESGCSTLTSAACTTAGGTWQAGTCGVVVCPAIVYNEVGDAGDLPGTAQTATGTGSLLKIKGNIGAAGEGDMYQIKVCDAANFSATTVGNGNTLDTILSFYRADGTGVSFNDDEFPGTTLQSRITNLFVAPAGNGNYYIHVSQWNKIPFSASGNIWINDGIAFPYRSERAPDGPGAAGPITGWNASTGTGTGAYTIAFTGACWVPAAVACYANCDGSTSNPLLTANDFQCFLNEYAAGNSYANCDGSTSNPLLTANDFQCFLNSYAAGCS